MTDDPLAETLDVLTHEIRLDVLRTLAESDGPLTFSELKSRVGVRDSGRFNYHLTRLCRGYLRETEGGYDLTYRGESLLVAAGDGRPDRGTVDAAARDEFAATDDACPVCGETDCDRLIHVHLGAPAFR